MNNRDIQIRLSQTNPIEQKHPETPLEAKEKKIIKLPIPSYKREIKTFHTYDLREALRGYDKKKGLRRKIKGDQEDIKKLRLFTQKCGEKKLEVLSQNEIFELINLLNESKTIKGSASNQAVNQLKDTVANLSNLVFNWETLLKIKNALHFLDLDNPVNLYTFIQNLWVLEQTNTIHTLRTVNQLPNTATLEKICQDSGLFDQYFRTLHILGLQQCNTPEILNAIVNRPEIAWSIESITQIFYRSTKLKIKDNLEILFQKDEKQISEIYTFLSLLDRDRHEYLSVLTQDDLNIIYAQPENAYQIAQTIIKSDRTLPVTRENFQYWVCITKEAQETPKQESGCRIC